MLVRVDSIAVSLFVFTYNQHSPIYDVVPVEIHFEKPSIRLGAGILVYWVLSHFSSDELLKILLNMALPVRRSSKAEWERW